MHMDLRGGKGHNEQEVEEPYCHMDHHIFVEVVDHNLLVVFFVHSRDCSTGRRREVDVDLESVLDSVGDCSLVLEEDLVCRSSRRVVVRNDLCREESVGGIGACRVRLGSTYD